MPSQGDPRVLFVLNLLLSGLFSALIVFGLSFLGVISYSWRTVGMATAVLMVVTWVVVMR